MGEGNQFKLDMARVERTAAKLENPFGGALSPWEQMLLAGTVAYSEMYARHRLRLFTAEWNSCVRAEGREDLLWEALDDGRRCDLITAAASRHLKADLDLAAQRFLDVLHDEELNLVMNDLRLLEKGLLGDGGVVSVLHDDFGNTATVTRRSIYPYRGAPRRVDSLVLKITADYDNGFAYHVSVYETLEEAHAALEKFSCGTWHPVQFD